MCRVYMYYNVKNLFSGALNKY